MKPGSSKTQLLIILLVIIVLGGLGWWYWNANLRNFIATDDASLEGNRVSISSKVLGRIKNLLVNEGDQVTAGQLLIELDDSDLRAQELQSQAALNSAEQNVLLAKVGLDRSTEDFQRAESLYKNGLTSKEQYDHAQKALETARAQYSISQAQVNSAQAQLQVVRTQLQNTRIIAPLNGVISKRWMMPGDVIQAGQAVFSVYDLENIWVTANFEETKLASIHRDQPVEIIVDAYKSRHFKGRIKELGTNTASQFSLIPPNNASGNFTKVTQRVPVKISIEHPVGDNRLLPGMSAEVKVRVN